MYPFTAWTGLLDWITVLDYWTHIKCSQTHFSTTKSDYIEWYTHTCTHGAEALHVLSYKKKQTKRHIQFVFIKLFINVLLSMFKKVP